MNISKYGLQRSLELCVMRKWIPYVYMYILQNMLKRATNTWIVLCHDEACTLCGYKMDSAFLGHFGSMLFWPNKQEDHIKRTSAMTPHRFSLIIHIHVQSRLLYFVMLQAYDAHTGTVFACGGNLGKAVNWPLHSTRGMRFCVSPVYWNHLFSSTWLTLLYTVHVWITLIR